MITSPFFTLLSALRLCHHFLPPLFLALLLTTRLVQAQATLNTGYPYQMRYAAGPIAPPPASSASVPAHQFLLSDGSNNLAAYPSLVQVMRSGRVGLGLAAPTPDSWLQVGQSAGTSTLDDIGGDFDANARVNGNPVTAATAQAPNGGACLGLNAVRQATYDGYFRLQPRNGQNGGAVVWSSTDGALSFSTIPSTGSNTNWVSSPDVASPAAYCRLKINPSGSVQIGRRLAASSTHLANYKLAVDGKLVAQSVYVLNPGDWADFVFEPTYRLLPLPELERYLHANKHLPTMPTTQQVQANGVDVGAMQARLLQQVEELTLRVIELAKQNERLQAEVTKLAAKQ